MAAMFEQSWQESAGPARLRLAARSLLDVLAHAILLRLDGVVHRARPMIGRSLHTPVVGVAFARDLWRDFRYVLRSLRRQPTFTAVAVATIALATAATTSVLSIRNGLLLRPLPVEDIESLYIIDEDRGGRVSQPFSVDAIPYERYLAYRDALTEEFSGLVAERYRSPGGFSVASDVGAISANGYLVSGNYFDVLGVRPELGGFFSDDRTDSVVLSHDFWRTHFGSRNVVGMGMQIDSRPFTIVGVAPPGFRGTMRGLAMDLWIPAEAYLGDPARFDTWFNLFGRVRPGVSRERAAAAVDRVGLSIPAEATTVRGVVLAPLTGLPPRWQEGLDRAFVFLIATGIAVLCIAAANVVGMLLARGIVRRREIAIRLALGAGRRQLVAHTLSETLMLFALGGVAGAWLGAVAARRLETIHLPFGPDLALDFTPDPTVLVTGLLLTTAVGAVFGLLPSLRTARGHPGNGLRLEGDGRGEVRVWRALVVGQLGVSVLLLVTAGLFLRSWRAGAALDIGFDPDGIVVAQIDLGVHGYDETRGRAFYGQLLERLRALPATRSASLANAVLLGSSYGQYRSTMRPADAGAPETRMNSAYAVVDPQYFETIGIEIVAGRAFTAADGPGAPSAAIVNEVLAETLWPGENPVGRTFTGVGTNVVVGVARDAKVLSVGEPPSPFVFRPVAQDYASLMTIHMRSDLPEGAALEEMRRVVRDMDPRIALQGEESMAEIVGETLFPQRFGAGLLSIFAAAGLFFAAIGIYGMLHFLVAQRRREAGIRLALGARPLQLSWELTRKGFGLTTVALVLGLLVSLPVAALLRSVMIGVSPFDPATFLVVAVLTMAVAIVASSFPARSATRADPLEALKSD